MSAVSYDALRTAMAALGDGLISQADYDAVKESVLRAQNSFLRAQQIRAGLDAGVIPDEELENVKRAFLESLSLPSSAPVSARAGPGVQHAFAAAGPPRQDEPALQQRSVISNHLNNKQPAPPPPQHPPAPTSQPAAVASPPRAPSTAQPPQSAGSGPVRLGRTPVPTNIPNLGGRRPKQNQGVSMSGISVSDDAVNMYYFMKAKSMYRWATWMINSDGKEVIIADVGDKDSPYDELLSVLPASDCRYGVYDYQFTNSEGCIFNKLVFLNWAPDSARIKAKMMYASTKDYFKGFLDGVAVELQGSDLDDITEKDVADAVRSTVTRQ